MIVNTSLDDYLLGLTERVFSVVVFIERNDTIILKNGYGSAKGQNRTKII